MSKNNISSPFRTRGLTTNYIRKFSQRINREKVRLLNKKYTLIFSMLVVLVASSCIMAVSATTYNYKTDEIPVGVANFTIGFPVHLDIYTNNNAVAYVTVYWAAPNGTYVYSDTSSSAPSFDGTNYHFTVPDHIITVGGNWWIYTYYYSAGGQQLGYEVQDAQVPVPLTPVPELPMVGTAGGVAICLLAAFAYVSKIRSNKQSKKTL